jgi:hypothetical protein
MKKYLLPHFFQPAGLIIFLAGIVFSFLRFYSGIKPKFLDVNVFAVWSTYLDTKYMKVISNNIGEEISGFLTLLGLVLFVFSREKDEMAHFSVLRLKAVMITGYLWAIIILASFWLIFGLAFVNVMSLNLVLPLVLYSVIFRLILYRDRQYSRE